MHKQVSDCTVNFCPNSPESPFLEFQTRMSPPPMKNFRFEMTKVYSGIPPKMKNFRFEMTKVYSGIPPPKMKNFRFEMTKVYSGIPPQNEKLQISGDQSPEYPPPPMKNFRFQMTKVYSGIPPPKMKNFRFEVTKVYSGIPPLFQNEKLQIWDDQSLLRNTPPGSCNPGDRMWRLICIPRGYHSFSLVVKTTFESWELHLTCYILCIFCKL